MGQRYGRPDGPEDFVVLRSESATANDPAFRSRLASLNGGLQAVVGRQNVGLHDISRLEGTFICPEGAALVPAAKTLLARGILKADDTVVLLNTGTGLKYPGILEPKLPVLEVGAPLPV